MKSQFVALTLVALSLIVAFSALAQDGTACPSHNMATVQALRECVQHAYDKGYIDSAGTTQSLLAKIDAAQAAVDRGQPSVAINTLEAFIHEVEAQAGKHIEATHAQHLIAHAELVIQALSEEGT